MIAIAVPALCWVLRDGGWAGEADITEHVREKGCGECGRLN